MTDRRFDEMLRQVTGDPVPSAADVARMRASMMTEIRSTPTPEPIRPTHRVRWVVATAVVALVLLVFQLVAPEPARATLQEIAQVAESTAAVIAPQGQYARVVERTDRMGLLDTDQVPGSDHDIVYFLPTTIERWVSESETRLRTTVSRPVFLSPQDEELYYEAGLDANDMVGETTSQTITGVETILDERVWPTDTAELRALLESSSQDGSGRPQDIQVLDLALDLVRLPETPPELRAATILVISELDPELVDSTPDGGGVFAFEWDTPSSMRLIVSFDGAGHLVREQLILPDGDPTLGLAQGTIVEDTRYSQWEIVDAAEVP